MKRVIVICEGETEREFCRTILAPYFIRIGIVIQAPLIKQSMGGIVGWHSLKKQVSITLQNDPSAYVTTFIDYYGLYERHSFPLWTEAETKIDRNERMEILERGMKQDIPDAFRFRFIPYIQLHEFEGLLFIDYAFFTDQFESYEIKEHGKFQKIFLDYQNPELINNGVATAPSKRLIEHIEGYNKPIYGNLMAEAIGLNNIRNKCPRFNNWLNAIQSIQRFD